MIFFTDSLYLKVCHTKKNYIMSVFLNKRRVIGTFESYVWYPHGSVSSSWYMQVGWYGGKTLEEGDSYHLYPYKEKSSAVQEI